MKKLHLALTASALVIACQLTHAKGWVDVAQHNRFAGWACKSGSAQMVDVHVYANGRIIGAGKAGNRREDAVKNVCGSTSHFHGFDVPLATPADMLDGTMKDIIIYAIYNDGSHEKLDNTPIKVQFPHGGNSTPPPANFGDIVGRDLDVSGLGYVGHIGVWDGEMVVEAIGFKDARNTIKRTPWSAYNSNPTKWQTISPVTINVRHKYCHAKECLLTELENGDLVTMTGSTHGVREMAAKSAYVKFLIGAEYTATAQSSAAKQGYRYYSIRHCFPFGSSCQPRQIKSKPTRGIYRCDTFVLDAWGGTSALYSNALSGIKAAPFENRSNLDKWYKHIDSLTSWYRLQTPKNVYDNMQKAWW